MTLREVKQSIRSFVREYWDDQKLAEVYAFNRDGKMFFHDPCGCILGVTYSSSLHTKYIKCKDDEHYLKARYLLGAEEVEASYLNLGRFAIINANLDSLRQRRLSAILRAEMRRRERQKQEKQIQKETVTVND